MGGEGDAEPQEACCLGHPLPLASAHQEQRPGDGLLGEEWMAGTEVERRAARAEKNEGG